MIAMGKYVKSNALWKTLGALAVGVLCFVSANAAAQVAATRTSEGAMISHTEPKASTVIPNSHVKVEEALPAGATVVYSNFGSGDSLYDAGTGWTEAGEEANDYPLAEAMSFTPASSYLLVRIDVAGTYLQGTNGMKLVLAADNAGVPGKAISGRDFHPQSSSAFPRRTCNGDFSSTVRLKMPQLLRLD
jgi:hypothetical protein